MSIQISEKTFNISHSITFIPLMKWSGTTKLPIHIRSRSRYDCDNIENSSAVRTHLNHGFTGQRTNFGITETGKTIIYMPPPAYGVIRRVFFVVCNECRNSRR